MNKRELLLGMIAGMAGGALASMWINGATAFAAPTKGSYPKILAAEQFALMDPHGNIRGIFSVTNGMTTLALKGPDGGQMALGVGQGEASLSYVDKDHKNPFTLAAKEGQGPSFVLNNSRDSTGAGMGVTGGIPIVYLQDAHGNVRASLMLIKSANQTAMISLADAQRRLRVRIGGDDKGKGESSFAVTDENGNRVPINP